MNKFQDTQPVVTSINISRGGIPKRPVPSVRITAAGLEGDGHNHEKHYRPIQAVCLQDIEKLDELRSEGYPLFSGTTGENLTVKNLNINALPIGTILKFSGGVTVELTKVRQPCYVLDSIDLKLKEDIIGRCGFYAKVLKEGVLENGETISVIWPHTGAIFCGGQSRRMGRPKAGVVLPGGNTMIEHVYKELKAVCRHVVLVGHGEGVPERLSFLRRIDDRCGDCGPLGGLEALLGSGLDTEYMITPCDLPYLTSEVLSLLLTSGVSAPAVLVKEDETLEPMIGRYAKTLQPDVQKYIQRRQWSIGQFARQIGARQIKLPARLEPALTNANRPKDLSLMEASFSSVQSMPLR